MKLKRRVGIFAFGGFVFLFFLVWKLPEARIQNVAIAYIRSFTQPYGILFSAEKVRVGILFGPALKLYNVELKFADDESQVLHISFLKIRPHLFSLLSATKKVSISAELLGGDLSGVLGGQSSEVVVDLSLDSLSFTESLFLKKFLGFEIASGKAEGTIRLNLDFNQIQKSNGRVNLEFKELKVPAQAAFGLNLPKLSIMESNIEFNITDGQIAIRNIEIGKDLKTDDLVAKVTGDGQLDRYLERSRVNLKAVFEVSASVRQSFPLLEALLGNAKTPEGKYAYRITGSLLAPDAIPGP